MSSNEAALQIELGKTQQQGGDWRKAAHHFQRAAELDPMSAPAYLLLGAALSRIGEWEAVVQNYETAIRQLPGFADAYNNLGIALQEVKRDREAIAAYAKAIEIHPNHANAYFNLGKLSARFNEDAAAAHLFAKAIAIQPGHAYAYHELGSLQEKNGLLQEAAASYTRSMQLDPTRTIRENLAAVLTLLGDPAGIEQQQQLVREEPDNAEAHWNLGMGLLLHGRYAEGWEEYEWRMKIPRFYQHHHRFPQPRWQGEPLEGKTILLYGEQGHGDTLQFLRYVPFVVGRGGRIVLEVLPLLQPLLRSFPGIVECLAPTDAKPEFALQASLMSLPHLLRTSTIPPPASWPFESVQPVDQPRQEKLRVGLAWAGNPSQKRDHLRSIPIEQWKPLAEVSGVVFTSLQMGPSRFSAEASNAPFSFVEDCHDLPDFAALAEVVAKLDFVISIDSAVAHLAGTMGKAVWILLPNAVDWRWGLRSATTPWYPAAKLFRQTIPRDWSAVMANVASELRALAAPFACQQM